LSLKKKKIHDLIKKFNKWGLYANVIGQVIGTNEVIISHKGKIVAQIPTSALSDDTPLNFHNEINKPPDYLLKKWEWKENDLPLLAQIPIEIPLVDDSNKGVPISISQPNKESSIVFGNLAQLIKNQFVNT